jgi:hypothetical protein
MGQERIIPPTAVLVNRSSWTKQCPWNRTLGRWTLDAGGVERETGLSKDLLRMWEWRCSFPKPGRDSPGARRCTVLGVIELRAIARLMDAGMRPGKVVGCATGDSDVLAVGSAC